MKKSLIKIICAIAAVLSFTSCAGLLGSPGEKTVQYIRVQNGALEYIAAKTLHFSWRMVSGITRLVTK